MACKNYEESIIIIYLITSWRRKKMRQTFLLLSFLSLAAFSILNYSACSSSPSSTKLNKDYRFSDKQTITTYIVPTGNVERDETYSWVLHLDLQARGYIVYDSNQLLKEHSDKIKIQNHRQIADSLQSKKYLPSSDVYVVVSAVWDSAFVLTFYSEDRYVYWKEYQFSGMNVPTLTSRVTFFDKAIGGPVKTFRTSDTTYILSENNDSQWFYPEYPWMVIAKQLSRELDDIPICSIIDKTPARYQFNVTFWVDQSYREAFPKTWMDRLKLRTLYANDLLRSQLDIELAQLEFVEWNASFDRTLDNNLEKLYQTTRSNSGSLQIGITFNKDLKRNWTDRKELGVAYLLSDYAAITAQPSFPSVGQDWNSIEEAITLVHEIGHILGAIHVPNKNSIMYPSAGSLSYEFDEVNKKIIGATKSNFLNEGQKNRLVPYSTELFQLKDFPENNSNPILLPIYSVVTQINGRSKILSNDSVKTFSNLSTLLPNSEITLAVMGYIEYKKNNYEKAKIFFEQVLKINPDFAEVQYYLSVVLRKDGDNEQADMYKILAKPYSKFWIIDK